MEHYEVWKNFGIVLIVASILVWADCFVYWLLKWKRIQKRMLELYGKECCANLRRGAFQTQPSADKPQKTGNNFLFRTLWNKRKGGAEET